MIQSMVAGVISAAGGSSAADWLTAIGTLATAAVAVGAVVVTMWLAAVERKRSAQDRVDAENRLKDERKFAFDLRQRDRREASAGGLLGRIAGLMTFVDEVPGLNSAIATAWVTFAIPGRLEEMDRQEDNPGFVRQEAARLLEAREAARSIVEGGHSEVWGLGDARAVKQYRNLANLVESLTNSFGRQDREVQDLRRYALWVRVSLENLTETGKSLDPGIPPYPDPTRKLENGMLWQPSNPPQAWQDAIQREPGDPAYIPTQ